MANPYIPVVARAAAQYRVPADLLAALLRQESGFQPRVSSGAGAQGIAQFMPGTWSGSWNPFRSQSPLNPQAAIPAAALYLSRALKTNHGDVSLALASYNAGQGAVNQYHGIPPYSETQNYVKTILAGRSAFPGLASGQVPGGASTVTLPAPTVPATAKPQAIAPSGLETLANPAYQQTLGLQQLIQQNAANAKIPSLTLPLPAQTITQPVQAPQTPRQQAEPTVDLRHPQAPTQAAAAGGPQAGQVVKLAQQYLGTPYVWGGTTPKGFDCSGLVWFLGKRVGMNLPRTSEEQFNVGQRIGVNQLRPGDLVFFKGTHGGANDVGHEGIYIGGGRFLHAPHTGDVVKISNLNDPYYVQHWAGARRVFG